MNSHDVVDTRDLERRLSEAEATIQALLSGQIDAVVDSKSGSPVLLSKAQEALRQSEERYRRIVETTSEGVWLVNAGLETTYVNQRMAEMLGYSCEEMMGQSTLRFMNEDARAITELRQERRRREGLPETYENCFLRKDGTTVWALSKTNPIFDENGEFAGTLGLVSDMTEHRQFEEMRERLASIVDSSDDSIISETLGGTITSWNRGAQRLFGYAAEDVMGLPMTSLIPLDRHDEEPGILARIARGEAVEQIDSVRLRKDGSLVEVSLFISPIKDASGRVVGVSKIARDITDRRKQEAALRRSEEQLRQSQKMEAVGRLAGGIAHDFNNVLSVILSYSELVLGDLKVGDPMRDDVEEVCKAGRRAANLTRQLLMFSRQQVIEPKVLDLNDVLNNMDKMLRRILGEDVELVSVSTHSLGRVRLDPSSIEQVILNLVVNARDAMPTGGKLTIETGNVDLDEDYALNHAGVEAGPHVMLAVSDTGIGMDKQTQARIFEPFFTTKAIDKGTGLGLSTVYGIVHQSGGGISVSSEPGEGTSFKVYLPQVDAPIDGSQAPEAIVNVRGTETILLVEDEEQVRAVASNILRRHGYHVLDARHGGEALLLCERHEGTIHLLLTDVVMPQMSGPELAKRLAEIRPEMKVLCMSGYTDDSIVRHGILKADIAYLQKPITPQTLTRKVREVLDAPIRAGNTTVTVDMEG